jgi:hypothetical protein
MHGAGTLRWRTVTIHHGQNGVDSAPLLQDGDEQRRQRRPSCARGQQPRDVGGRQLTDQLVHQRQHRPTVHPPRAYRMIQSASSIECAAKRTRDVPLSDGGQILEGVDGQARVNRGNSA